MSNWQVKSYIEPDKRDPIRAVGPITIKPDWQQRGIGRQLMEAVLKRGNDAQGIRLMQDAYNVFGRSITA